MPFAVRKRFLWQLQRQQLPLGERTLVMAIVNITPDSFSGDGKHVTEHAVGAALAALEDGADILDLGAESTRPGATPLTASEELDRLLPVLDVLHRQRSDAVISVDTYHAATARAAVAAGAEVINDVSGLLWDSEMAAAIAAMGCGYVLMHTHGRPEQWKTQPRLGVDRVRNVVLEGLNAQRDAALEGGIARDRIVLDPGFGFGKLGDENFSLLAHFDQFQQLEQPLLAGLSRKSFLGGPVADRLHATLAGNTAAVLAGAHILRVHDVRAAKQAAEVADAILAAKE